MRITGITATTWQKVAVDGTSSYTSNSVLDAQEFILGFYSARQVLQIESIPTNFSEFHVCAKIAQGVYTVHVLFDIKEEAVILDEETGDTYCMLKSPPTGVHRENIAAIVNYSESTSGVRQIWGDFTVYTLGTASSVKTKRISIRVL